MGFGKGPPTLVCYICGREFGTASLGIHQKQCKELWIKREKAKPKSERRPLPTPPTQEQMAAAAAARAGGSDGGGAVGGGGMTREEFNEAALETFNNEAMKACPHCARTFLEDRLKIHLRSCRPDSMSRPVGAPRVGGGGGGALKIGPNAGAAPTAPIRNQTPGQRKKSVPRATGAAARRSPSGPSSGTSAPPGSAVSPYLQRTEIPKRPATMASGGRSSTSGTNEARKSSTAVSRVEMIQMVDDAEDEGLLTEEVATKLHALMTKEDAMLCDVYLAAKASLGKSVQRFARNAKRLLEQRANDASGASEKRDRSQSMPATAM